MSLVKDLFWFGVLWALYILLRLCGLTEFPEPQYED